MRRKSLLVTNEYYHVFNKSIEGFRIFNNKEEFERMIFLIRYYQLKGFSISFGQFIRLKEVEKSGVTNSLYALSSQNNKVVEIISYCLMPTHVHFVLQQLQDGGIENFMRLLSNSYACYFNTKYKRKGPLWVGRFKAVLIETDEQLIHLTRYVHLNPTTVGLVDSPSDWKYSSYLEYLHLIDNQEKFCQWDTIGMETLDYKIFVENYIEYQRELERIKHLVLEEV